MTLDELMANWRILPHITDVQMNRSGGGCRYVAGPHTLNLSKVLLYDVDSVGGPSFLFLLDESGNWSAHTSWGIRTVFDVQRTLAYYGGDKRGFAPDSLLAAFVAAYVISGEDAKQIGAEAASREKVEDAAQWNITAITRLEKAGYIVTKKN